MPGENATEILIKPVENEGELFQALAIREVVFIEEQSVPESLERDADDAQAFHVLAMEGGHAIGTGRLVKLAAPPEGQTGNWGRVGRMAVLQSNRKGGTGTRLLTALEAEARRLGLNGIILHAQLSAMEFYKRHGYETYGAVFEEAGMPHLEMKKKL
ncbi:MAG: GNAT family N-acetyltransferase [Archangium gephyra]|uniref:GNAT family N-acetyltransferase n=1 Tax=Archangium gephyra TaxID=48 RepID=A0A2W5T5Z8_9BACT|nr:MAG: GNAT family N-acetyltransferase [Archangium gephyra]